MNNTPIPPLNSFVNGYRKKMTTNTTVFLTSKSMFVVLRSRTSPMQIDRFNINIVFHPNQPLNFIIFFQSECIHFNITRDFYPVDTPSILFLEFSQKRTTFNFEDHSFLDFTSFSISEAGDNFVKPNANTTSFYTIFHITSIRLHA